VRNTFWLFIFLSLSACSVPLSTPAPAVNVQPTSAVSSLPWASLQLSGRLLLIGPRSDGFNLVFLDLASGDTTLVYHTLPNALLGSALVSPDGKQILLSYAPPPSGPNQITYASLYLLPIDGSGDPQPIFQSPNANEAFYNPDWSPDGKVIYASHFVRGPGDQNTSGEFTIDRVSLDGHAQTILRNASWPSISPDGSKIAYLSVNPANSQNELYLADITGENQAPLLSPGSYPAVDDHLYTLDGKTIIFSAVNNLPSPTPTVLDLIFGIKVVSAHNIPSDWYAVSLESGAVTRLTHINDTGMYAALSPDGKHLAFISQTGLYAMNIDGTELTQLSNLTATGSVDWIP
jgi:Tol biopolymer transport system component